MRERELVVMHASYFTCIMCMSNERKGNAIIGVEQVRNISLDSFVSSKLMSFTHNLHWLMISLNRKRGSTYPILKIKLCN